MSILFRVGLIWSLNSLKAVFDEHLKSGKILEIAKQLNYHTEEDMFAAIGYGEITVHKVINKLKIRRS